MADTKISGLPASTVPLAGTEVLPIVQSSTTKQVSIANVTAGRAVSALSVATTKDTTPSSSLGAFSYGTLGYTDVNHLATFQTSVASYAQVEIQNTSTDPAASADMVVGNSLTTASTYYGDFGMNSSGWIGTAPFNSPNNVYLTSTTADLAIGTTTANNILFGINGVEYSRISSVGNLLLAQAYDQGTGVLQVTGNSSFNGVVVDKSLNLQGGNNLITYSSTIGGTNWTSDNLQTVTLNSVLAPDGTTTGTTSVLTSSGVNRSIGAQNFISVSGTIYTASVWAYIPSGSNSSLILEFGSSASPTNQTFTPTTKWVKYTFTSTISLSGANSLRIRNSGTNTGDTLYVWGAQLELGTVASAYTPTTTAAITTTNNINVPSGSLSIQKPIATTQVAPTIASAATIAPITYITFISGTTTINTITAPSPLSTYGGQLVLIPTGLFLTGLSGNIAIASTSVVSKALIMTYDATTAKWYPSY